MNKLGEIANAKNIFFTIILLALVSCSNQVIPVELAGTYTGNNRIIVRYQKDGQYIFYEDNAVVTIDINNNNLVTGVVGGAIFSDCKIVQNRGWIARQLNIKTDYLITGKLSGSTFGKDSILEKDITIPFNMADNEFKGSLFLTSDGQKFPLISFLKLQKI